MTEGLTTENWGELNIARAYIFNVEKTVFGKDVNRIKIDKDLKSEGHQV